MAALPLSNVPPRRDVEVYRGSALVIPFAVVTTPGGSTARSLVGYTINAHLRRNKLDASPAATFAVVVEDAVGGLFCLHLTGAQTAALKCGERPGDGPSQYWWDVRIADALGVPDFLQHGAVTVFAQATVLP